MNSIAGEIGALLVTLSAIAGLWLARREGFRRRARYRLEEAAREAGARSPAPTRLHASLLKPPLWPSVLTSLLVLAVCVFLRWDALLASGLAAVAGTLVHVAFAAFVKQRALQLEEGLAEAISLASSALRAGASPVDALERSARAVRGPTREILLGLTGRLRLGDDAESAFEALAERVPLESFRLFSIALAVQWRAGGSLERSLAVVARAVRDRVELERRIHTQAAPTRASVFAFVAATGGIAYLMWQHDPANLEHFVSSSAGSNLVGGAIWLQAIAIFWMWRLSQVRV